MRAAHKRGSVPLRGARRGARTLAVLALVLLGGCSRDRLARQGGMVSRAQADSYLRDAIRKSSEGVVLEPSQQGLEQIERTRLAEIAQQLRSPAAICFLERAILTMEPGVVDDEETWVEVPEGQAKFRARIGVDGVVLTTEVLESGFSDTHMEACLTEIINNQVFVESRDSFAYFIDIYYWVSLGFFAEAQSEDFQELMRRRQTEAGIRAKGCLRGRVRPGEYIVEGLNLFDRDGRTLINRIDHGGLPQDVSTCVASTLKQVTIHGEPDSFVRPAEVEVHFIVGEDGGVGVSDERWLELIELEERAAREERKARLLDQPIGSDGVEVPPDGLEFIDEGEPPLPGETPGSAVPTEPRPGPSEITQGPSEMPPRPRETSPESSESPEPSETPSPEPSPEPSETPPPSSEPAPAPKPAPTGDPSKPGTKLDLSPRRGK